MTISELKEHNIAELGKLARGLDIAGTSGLRKQDLIFKILPVSYTHLTLPTIYSV